MQGKRFNAQRKPLHPVSHVKKPYTSNRIPCPCGQGMRLLIEVDYSPRCQMSLLYSAIVRSLLNRPALAMLMTHFLRQPSGSQA